MTDEVLNHRFSQSGLRFTPQRRHVYSVLVQHLDHPTADQVFIRSKTSMPEISMATVYNCLDALVQCGLVRQVNLDRDATRYCPNMKEHCHFYCAECGHLFDIDLSESAGSKVQLPDGFKATHIETSIRGVCSDCAAKKAN